MMDLQLSYFIAHLYCAYNVSTEKNDNRTIAKNACPRKTHRDCANFETPVGLTIDLSVAWVRGRYGMPYMKPLGFFLIATALAAGCSVEDYPINRYEIVEPAPAVEVETPCADRNLA